MAGEITRSLFLFSFNHCSDVSSSNAPRSRLRRPLLFRNLQYTHHPLAFCQLEELCHQVDLQQLWGPMFRGCWRKAVDSGTAFQLVLGKRTSTMNICLGAEIVAHCDYLFKMRLSKFSYLLTINCASDSILDLERVINYCIVLYCIVYTHSVLSVILQENLG